MHDIDKNPGIDSNIQFVEKLGKCLYIGMPPNRDPKNKIKRDKF
jgi:hypothetical protein